MVRNRGQYRVIKLAFSISEISTRASAGLVPQTPCSAAGSAGTLGRAGAAQAAGLAELTGAEFGGGPPIPMLPDSWGETPRTENK